MKYALLATAIMLTCGTAFAQSGPIIAPDPLCPPGTTSCTVSQQHQGDVDNSSSADGSQSEASQSNPSSNSNASGVDIGANYDNSAQTTQNATNTTTGTISGGNTSSDADATGNRSDNDNDNTNNNQSGVSDSGNSENNNQSSATGGQGGQGGQGGNSDQSQGQGQGQGQGQAQGIDNSGNSASTATGGAVGDTTSGSYSAGGAVGDTSSGSSIGDTSLSNGSESTANNGGNTTQSSADNSGGNSAVVVDASDRSSSNYNSQALFIPSVQAAPAAIVAGANVIVDRGVCGPLQAVESTQVNGVYIGMLHKSSIDLGTTDRLVDFAGGKFLRETGPDGVERLYGSRPVSYVAVIGVAGSRSIGLGGGKTGGDWGNAGASGGSSMQRLVIHTNLESCEYAKSAVVFHEVPAKRIRK